MNNKFKRKVAKIIEKRIFIPKVNENKVHNIH